VKKKLATLTPNLKVRRNPLMLNLLKAKVKTTLNSKVLTPTTCFKDYLSAMLRIRAAMLEQSPFEISVMKNCW
jgi:hypothetical protein